MDQALLLRGSRDFTDRAAYARFLREILDQRNAGRREPLRRGTGRTTSAAAGATGELQAGSGSGPFRKHHPCGPKRLFGRQPFDRRAGGRSALRRRTGGLVRRQGGRADSPPPRAAQASDQLPARDRLVGAQARRFRELPLPRRPLSHEPISNGLRRTARDGTGPSLARISSNLGAGGPGERIAGGQRPASPAGGGAGDHGAGR